MGELLASYKEPVHFDYIEVPNSIPHAQALDDLRAMIARGLKNPEEFQDLLERLEGGQCNNPVPSLKHRPMSSALRRTVRKSFIPDSCLLFSDQNQMAEILRISEERFPDWWRVGVNLPGDWREVEQDPSL